MCPVGRLSVWLGMEIREVESMRRYWLKLRASIFGSRLLACLVILLVAHSCALKGFSYVATYPGWLGWLLFALSPFTAVVVGRTLLWAATERSALISRHIGRRAHSM